MRTPPTYTRDQIKTARSAWDDFSDEWDEWRQLAARGPGIIFPPDGTQHDSWADGHPSQRAILVRAMRETPDLLRWAIRGASTPSWARVIERLLAGRDEMHEQVDLEAARDEQNRAQDPTPRQATYAIGEILTIIGDST